MPILICIISAFFWAIFDLTIKLSLKKINSVNLLLIFTITQFIIFLIWIFIDNFSINLIPYLLPGIILIFVGLFSALLLRSLLKIIFCWFPPEKLDVIRFGDWGLTSYSSIIFFEWAIIKNSILWCFFDNFWSSYSLFKKNNLGRIS